MKTIQTAMRSTCSSCGFTEVEGNYTVSESETPGFWLGFAIATIGNIVVSVVWRLMGWG